MYVCVCIYMNIYTSDKSTFYKEIANISIMTTSCFFFFFALHIPKIIIILHNKITIKGPVHILLQRSVAYWKEWWITSKLLFNTLQLFET